MLALWEARQARSTQRTKALEGLGTPTCIRTGSVLARAPVLGGYASQDTNAGKAHNGKGKRAFYGPVADPCLSKRAQRGAALQGCADESNASLSLLRDSHAYVAGPFRAPVVGLERPTTLRHRLGADYVTGAPGAPVTPHREGPGKALTSEEGTFRFLTITSLGLQEPKGPRIVELEMGTLCAQLPAIAWRKALGTLCAQGPDDPWREGWGRYVPSLDRLPLYPLGTSKSTFFRLFRLSRLFRQIQAALAYPLDQNVRERAK